jgi:hypothetical protein
MPDRRFVYLFSNSYRIVALPFGITPSSCEVRAGSGRLFARFGPWHIETALDNIDEVAITGPYAFVKTAGPAHLSLKDKGLTFATNGDRGVYLTLREPIRGMDPFGLIRHPNLTVTVDDCEGLATAIQLR